MATTKLFWLLVTFTGILLFEHSWSQEIKNLGLRDVIHDFTYSLYKKVSSSHKNIVISPISLHMGLMMAALGADGTTAQELIKTLGIHNQEKVLKDYNDFIKGLDVPYLKLAVKMFVEESVHIFSDFEQQIYDTFLLDIQKANFRERPRESRMEINQWVENNTDQKIKELLSSDSVSSLTKLILVNAVHFRADWKEQFDKRDTKIEEFYVKPNFTLNVPMMAIRGQKFRYAWKKDLGAQILELPYAVDGFKMVIVLPDEQFGLAGVESKLFSLNYPLSSLLSSLRTTKIDVYLPKFRIKQNLDMGNILSELGMPTAFSDEANFSRISNSSLKLSKVVHKAVILVNEKGSEAAAASGLTITSKTFPLEFMCNEPFIFMILKEDIILFFGRISKPHL